MAQEIRSVLGFGVYLVLPSERITDHPVDGLRKHWLPANASIDSIQSLL